MSEDVVFVEGNDRYQIVSLSVQGTTATSPEFRYWNAAAPQWGEALSSDTSYPAFYTLNEYNEYVPGSIELPFQSMRDHNIQVEGVLVDFNTRPSSIDEDIADGSSVGFQVRVEGYGVPSYSRTLTGVLTSGIATSTTFVFTSTVQTQAHQTWPNTRTAWFPVRLSQKVRSARVILSDIHLVEILRVQLIGSRAPERTL